jgi:nucleotide-binding universal stress UspA family protein
VDPKANPDEYRSTLYADDWMNQHDASANDVITHFMEYAADRLRRVDLPVETHIFEGNPGPVLLRHARDFEADVLFLGATGSDHGGRRSLGSLVSWLITRAPCSMEIVRAGTVPLTEIHSPSASTLVDTAVCR